MSDKVLAHTARPWFNPPSFILDVWVRTACGSGRVLIAWPRTRLLPQAVLTCCLCIVPQATYRL